MNTYAIEVRGLVVEVVRDPRDAGSDALSAEITRRAAALPGATWVYVEEQCKPGDVLDIDEEGCARVISNDDLA